MISRAVSDIPAVEAIHLDQFRCVAGSTQILANASVSVAVKGKLSAIIGPNGGGKSTLVKLFTGHLNQSGLFLEGAAFIELTRDGHRDLVPVDHRLRPGDAARCNIEYVPQEPAWPSYAQPRDMFVAGSAARWYAPVSALQRYSELARVAKAYGLSFPAYTNQAPNRGDLQRALLARALQRLGPGGLLVLDEATASLPLSESLSFLRALRARIGAGEISAVMVTHRPAEIECADQRLEVRQGRVFHAMSTATAPANVANALSTSASASDPSAGCRIVLAGGHEVTVAPGSAARLVLESAAEEEELFLSLISPGNQTLALLVMDGEDLTEASVHVRRRAGLRVITGDRRRFGVFDDLSVVENIAIGQAVSKPAGWVDLKSARGAAEKLGISALVAAAPAWSVSGGYQQRTLIARELDFGARFLVAFNLSQGVDAATVPMVEGAVSDLLARGGSALLVGSD